MVLIIGLAGQAPSRRSRLSSNVRPRGSLEDTHMSRRFETHSIDLLETIVARSPGDFELLLELSEELGYRSTRRAKKLRRSVDSLVAKLLAGPAALRSQLTPVAKRRTSTMQIPVQPVSKTPDPAASRSRVVPSNTGAIGTTSVFRLGKNQRPSPVRCTVCGFPAIPGDSVCYTHNN